MESPNAGHELIEGSMKKDLKIKNQNKNNTEGNTPVNSDLFQFFFILGVLTLILFGLLKILIAGPGATFEWLEMAIK